MTSARLAPVELPDFGVPERMPELPTEVYEERLRRARERVAERGLDLLVVYADREHSANLSYLTGFDPRFEEAVLVLGPEGEPAILVGNECYGMAGAAPLPMRRHLFQDLSLTDQPRDRSQSLEAILGAEGVSSGVRVGVAGWKTYARPDWLEVPSFLVDTLRELVGSTGSVENANDILIDPADGLRTTNEVEQLIAFEYAACHTSEGVKRLLRGLRPGLTEQEGVALLGWNGMPLSCHLMLTAGPRAKLGLLSPSDRVDRAWRPVHDRLRRLGLAHLSRGVRRRRRVGAPRWHRRLRRAARRALLRGGRRVVHGAADRPARGRAPGDRRPPARRPLLRRSSSTRATCSISTSGSRRRSGRVPRSRCDPGMAMQVDIIPATGTPYFTTNIEDGIALADETLRDELAARDPGLWRRVQARRAFMRDALGIELHADVLPLSNLAAWLPPFLLDAGRAMTLRAG